MGSRELHSGQWWPNKVPMRNCFGTTWSMAHTAKTKAQPIAISTATSLPVTHILTYPWQGCLALTDRSYAGGPGRSLGRDAADGLNGTARFQLAEDRAEPHEDIVRSRLPHCGATWI